LHQPVASQVAEEAWPVFNIWWSTKGLASIVILVILFLTPIPREISAMAVSGILLCSRKLKTRSILGLIDWHLIILFCALFIVIEGISNGNYPKLVIEYLKSSGIDLHNLYILAGVSAVLSNLVSNVPATMLLLPFLDPTNPVEWYSLAVSSTFAGNLILIGSIANLIVAERASPYGIAMTFKEHAVVGIPITIFSLMVLFLWTWI